MASSSTRRYWDRCFLCQSIDTDNLRDPKNNSALIKYPETRLLAYKNALDNLVQMKRLHTLPDIFCLDDIDLENCNIDVMSNYMQDNGAKWHKSCKQILYNKKRPKNECAESNESPIKTRRMINFEQSMGSPCIKNSETANFNLDLSVNGEADDDPCIFCNQYGGTLHKAATMALNKRVNQCARKLGDRHLLAKLAAGHDTTAINTVYHLNCLSRLYKKAKSVDNVEQDSSLAMLKAQAFSELVDFVESHRGTSTVFIVAELVDLYTSRLISLGIDSPRQHSTRLRQSLLEAIPDLMEVQCPINKRTNLA
jgi:hypothetical protein